jgi:hypothetical protein
LNLLRPVLLSNGGALREIRTATFLGGPGGGNQSMSSDQVDKILEACPHLVSFVFDGKLSTGEVDAGELPRMLRAPAHPWSINIQGQRTGGGAELVPNILDLATAAMRTCKNFGIYNVQLGESLDALADIFIAGDIKKLDIVRGMLSSANLPALARILRHGSLVEFGILHDAEIDTLLAGPFVSAFCEALRASRLELLQFHRTCLWDDEDDGLALIRALIGHPTLRWFALAIGGDDEQDDISPAIKAALDALRESIPWLEC